jgi:hypothetical protein
LGHHANGVVLAHVCGQPDGAIAVSDTRLTNDEARVHSPSTSVGRLLESTTASDCLVVLISID